MNESETAGDAGQTPAQTDDAVAPDLDPAALEARVKELEGQQGDLTDRLLRAHAEMDNLRKRTERDKSDSAKYAITKFALDIVGVSDNFQRAVAAVPPGSADEEGTLKSVVDGVQMTERAFLQVLERHGVRRIDPQGEPFNPTWHQAVMEQDSPDVPAGKYQLQIDGETAKDAPNAIGATLKLERGHASWLNWVLLQILLLLVPLWGWWRAKTFETSRWADSDHPRSGGDDGDDD